MYIFHCLFIMFKSQSILMLKNNKSICRAAIIDSILSFRKYIGTRFCNQDHMLGLSTTSAVLGIVESRTPEKQVTAYLSRSRPTIGENPAPRLGTLDNARLQTRNVRIR